MRRDATFAFSFLTKLVTDERVFAMHQYRLIHFRQLLRAFVELPVVHIAEIIIDTAVTAGGNKAFKANDTDVIQFVQTIEVVRNQPPKLRGINGQLAFSRIKFQFDGFTIHRCWQLVEGHFDHRGDTAFCRGTRPCLISFPMGTTWLRDMGMRINHTR